MAIEKNTDIGIFILEAYKLFKSGKYRESANFIESISMKYKMSDNSYLNYLLIINYLHLGNFSKVQNIINLLRRNHPDNESLHEVEAYIILKGAPGIESALMKYIECSENFPGNRKFRKILENLRKCENFQNYQKTVKLEECTVIKKPEYRRSITNWKRSVKITKLYSFQKAVILFLVTFITLTFLFIITRTILHKIHETATSNQIYGYKGNLISLDDARYSLIDKNSVFDYIKFYSNESELKKDFISAQYFLKENKVNEALILLNSIYNSNANLAVREKVIFLQDYISGIDIRERSAMDLQIESLLLNPGTYNGVFVKFSGIPYNIKNRDTKTVFTLEIDKSGKRYFIEVYFDKEVHLKENQTTVITGKFINKINNDKIYLEGIKVE